MATEAINFIPCPGCENPYNPATVEASEIAFCPQCRFPLTLLANKYRLERLLNQGGFGMLYLARHVGLDQFNERVIKVLKPELFAHLDVLRRFRREVQLTARLSEQNNHIVRIYDDFGEAPGLGQYYVMEYLRGVTLDALQETGRPLAFGLSFHIFFQLCKALGASHRAGVIHRDLKPDNLFLIKRDDDPHFVKVIDFGLARPEDGNTQMGSFATKQQVMGTPAYMSPEQCQGEDIDNRSDIYAMGILLYQMLSGYHPFPLDASDTMALFFAHISGEPTPLTLNAPALPKALNNVVLKALAKEPDDRYDDAESFWEALLPFSPDGANYASLMPSTPHYATTPASSPEASTDTFLDPLGFEATAAVLPAISGDLYSDLASAGIDASAVELSLDPSMDPSAAPMTIEINDGVMAAESTLLSTTLPAALPSANPHELITNDTTNHRVEAFVETDVMPLAFEEKAGREGPALELSSEDYGETFIAGMPDLSLVEEEEDTDDVANHSPSVPLSDTTTPDPDPDDDPYFDDDDDDATSISKFTPPKAPPVDDGFFEEEDEDGDTSISTAPLLTDAATEDVPTLGQEIAAVPSSEMAAVLAATTPRVPAVATPQQGRAQRSRPIRESSPSVVWNAAPPTIEGGDLLDELAEEAELAAERPGGGVTISSPTKLSLSEDIDPLANSFTPGQAHEDEDDELGEETTKQPWVLWVGVILAILGIVLMSIWLLTNA